MIVILIAAISADGKIAQTPGQKSLDWTSKEDLKFFVAKTKEAGTVVMGRTTFETIGKPLKDRRTIVMTREGKGSVEGIEYTSESPRDLVARLEQEGVATLALCGGAQIYGAFLKEALVDELFLTVEPVLFGNGVPLGVGFDRLNLELIETTMLNDQAILLHYRVRK